MTRPGRFLNASMVTIILMSAVTISTQGYNPEKNDIWRLRKELFARRQYDKNVRPIGSDLGATKVKLQFTFFRIRVDESKGDLVTHGWLSMIWNATNLRWRPRDYNNLTSIKVPSSEVWLPDIIVHNSYDGVSPLPDSLVSLHHNGNMFYLQKLTLATQCDLDLTYWPLDNQSCHIRVGAWASDAYEVEPLLWDEEQETIPRANPTNHVTEIPTYYAPEHGGDAKQRFVRLDGWRFKVCLGACSTLLTIITPDFTHFEAGSSPWEVVGASSRRYDLQFAPDVSPHIDVIFSVELQRRSPFDVKMVFTPAVVISVLVLITFWMTPGSPERIHVGCVAVLVNTIMLVYFRHALPAAGNHVPLVVIFYVATLSLSAFGVLITLVTGNLSRRSHMHRLGGACMRNHSQSNVCTLSKGSLESERSLKIHDDQNSDMDDLTKTIPLTSFTDSLPPPSFTSKRPPRNWQRVAQLVDRFSFFLYFVTIFVLSFKYLIL